MPIADSDNPAHQRAFKSGYRYGLAGKSIGHMPHDIRQDGELRDYFAQGWESAQEDLVNQQAILSKPNWRYRLAWISVMIIGGIATAGVMLKQVADEKQQPNLATIPEPSLLTSESNALMSAGQRDDMLFRQQQFDAIEQSRTPLQAVTSNPNIELITPVLTAQLQTFTLSQVEHIEKSAVLVPKYLRKLEFTTQVRLNKPQNFSLHWRFAGLIIQQKDFQLDAGEHQVKSIQAMSAGRQGQWYLEFIDAEQHVFARMAFYYGTKNLQ